MGKLTANARARSSTAREMIDAITIGAESNSISMMVIGMKAFMMRNSPDD